MLDLRYSENARIRGTMRVHLPDSPRLYPMTFSLSTSAHQPRLEDLGYFRGCNAVSGYQATHLCTSR